MAVRVDFSYSPFLPPSGTMSLVPTARACLVSFTDSEGIRHAVEVTASSLYEAAALAIAEIPALWIHYSCNRPGCAPHRYGENAGHVARQQNRGVA